LAIKPLLDYRPTGVFLIWARKLLI
jgi:hypothetical protein